VNLRCRLLSLLRIHRPDCQLCSARERYGVEMRKRLEELNWRRQNPVSNRDDGLELSDSKRTAESVASPPLVDGKKETKKSA
jgi:hypothetical protein